MINKKYLLILVIILITIRFAYAYESNPSYPVHQYIANESQFVWKLIPYEIKEHIGNPLDNSRYPSWYNDGDDVISGSGEEDIPLTRAFSHFWEPDSPRGGRYDDGLNYPWEYDSSYRKALGYWNQYVIPYYLKGDIDEAYYWLGRVTHLLEDATVPAHMHNDPHPFVKSLENYTKYNYQNWQGSTYSGDQYNYEAPPNMDNFNWDEVYSNYVSLNSPGERGLFRLFWYTAQKTQYYASDDEDGNSVYVNLSNDQNTFSSSLWTGDGVTIINNQEDVPANVDDIANAVVPHAMKSVAGLYRLFWDAVAIDWPFYHHDLRRTGFTLLKGNLQKTDDEQTGWTLDDNVDTSAFDFPSIADIDSDGKQEILTATSITRGGSGTDWEGRFYVLECKESRNRCRDFTEKWKFVKSDVIIGKAPSIDDLDDDGVKEVVFAGFPVYDNANDGTVYAFKANKRGKLDEGDARYKYDLPSEAQQDPNDPGEIGHTAIADIDLDGKKEVLVADYTGVKNWQGYMYVLEPSSGHRFSLQQKVDIGPYALSGGAKGAIAIANIDSDDYPEIIVPASFGIYVYEYDGNNIVKKWNNSDAAIYHTAVVADVDADNSYEIVYVTTDSSTFCPTGVTCTKKLHIIDALTKTEECSVTLPEYPFASPAVGNLNSDNKLEIVLVTRNSVGSGSSTGYIRTYDYNCNSLNSFSPGDTYNSAADIFDIDNDGDNNVIVAGRNGTLYVLDNNLNYKWDYDLGGEIASAPAIGDLDGDGVAEIAAKRFTSPSQSMMNAMASLGKTYITELTSQELFALGGVDTVIEIIEGNNTQPVLDYIEDVYAIEGDLINLTVTSTEYDLDEVNYSFSSPLNESGFWQTDENSSGTYEVLVEVSDGNLTDSQFLTLTVYENGTELENNFSTGENFKELNFTQADNKTVYVNLSKDINISRAALKVKGFSLSAEQNTFQEPTPVVIEGNELTPDLAPNQSIDKNWDTYYSAGKATGEIVEIQGLSVPNNITHILFHLKLRVYGGGYGKFAVYNYNTQEYEIVTSLIPSFTDLSKNVYFDLYETNPLFLDNDTSFSLKVSNVSDYISNNNVRWYYRYVGDWASQMIYESEVKFEEEVIYPRNIKLDVGNNSVFNLEYDGELHSNYIKVDSFNNTNKNETISLNNNSVTRYIKLPKDAILTKAEISVGDKAVETLSMSEINNKEINNLQSENIFQMKGENFNTYKNNDGSYSTLIYNKPVNYYKDGKYLPIDTKIQPSLEADYEVIKGIYKAYFKNNLEIKIEKNNTFIIFKPIINKTVGIPIIDNNQIAYKDIFKNIDLRYTYNNAELKEDFVLNSLPSFNEIKFTFDTNGLIEKTNNAIKIKKDNETIFYITNLYAYDATKSRKKLDYELNNNIFTIHLPVEWLKEAVYPVTIDPTTKISISAYGSVEADNDESCDIRTTSSLSSSYRSRSLLRFPLTSLPYCKTVDITEAKVYLEVYDDTISSGECGTYPLKMTWKSDDSWSCSSLDWSDASYHSDVLDTVCAYNSDVWYNWDVYVPGKVDIVDDFIQNCDDQISFVIGFTNENADPTEQVEFYTNSYLNVTYNIIPSNTSVLVGCGDGYTTKNSDGSDINVDLWDCFYDNDTNASDATFSILAESNTTLIDCSINTNRYVNCGAPAANALGYSDVNVSVVDDMNNSDEDTIRIYVKPHGNATVSINNTEVFFNSYYKYRDLDIKLEIENYLEICENDSNGNCYVPIEIEADDSFDFNINSIDINYNLNELEFKDALQNYIDSNCVTDNCTVPLTFSLDSEGQLNLTNLQVFYKEIVDNPPTTTLINPPDNSIDEDGNITFNCSATDDYDLDNITLYGDWGNGWHANETKSLSGISNSTTFNKTLDEGSYIWNCLTYDNASQSDWANTNWTINVSIISDTDYPYFSNFNVNESVIEENEFARFSVDIFDATSDISYANGTIEGATCNFIDSGADEWYYDWQCTSNNANVDFTWIGANDTYNNWNQTSIEGVSVNCNITIPQDTNKFYIKDSSGNNVAWFGDLGNIVLAGTCTASADCNAPPDSFIFKGANYDTVAYIDSNGNLCIQDSNCDDNDNSCEATRTPDSFIIKNGNDVVAYINKTGGLCLEGSLTESGSP